jgi:GNAT superfamily N-acetyltransferase
VEIRAAVAEDRDALEALTNARCPHNEPWVLDTVVGGLTGAMTLDAFVVAVEDARPVGWAFTGNIPGTPVGHRSVYVVVALGHEGRGVGRALFSRVLASVPAGSDQLRSRVFDDDERGLAVAEHWGFEVTQRSIASTLLLEAGSGPEPPEGVVLEPSDDLVFTDEDAVEAMFAASQTNPEATTSHVMTLGEIREYVFPGERPLGCLARVGGVPAALTFVIVAPDGKTGNVVYTGVDPRFRGRGLGKLVKHEVQHRARSWGVERFVTENEENNHGIRALNADMGYVVLWGVYRMRRTITPGEIAPG